ncbi:hypothetical protein GALMADRAFT_135488 [Galerina marginata CBS 339.88]|uniref:DUF6593 domain-containing protein n=1 Tax=Galerina marginata (strain CBS 339.88) TaxID=685588 RepID=A0A067TQD2_GALM3|nr:hypothetical protein GALMADRAFT_135488 [Galerina marginata CBS 339.88]
MQLCLVNNDPTATLLVTPDGDPLYSIETPPLSHPSTNPLAPSLPRKKSATTTIKRLERFHRSVGHLESEIGVVEYRGPETGTHLQLCVENHTLAIPPRKAATRTIANSPAEDDENNEQEEISWGFKGPDSRPYKWQMFVHSPVLLLDDNSFTPLARYRRAKLGIVSRSRRAFLEILPAGINLIDFIVVTFVGFMKQRVLVEGVAPPADIPDSGPNSVTRSIVAAVNASLPQTGVGVTGRTSPVRAA